MSQSQQQDRFAVKPLPVLNPDAIHNLTHEDIRALETLRQPLLQLAYSVDALKSSLAQTGPEPPSLSHIQRQALTVNKALDSLQRYINDTNHDGVVKKLLAQLHPYPIAPYPNEEKFALVDALIRKKPQPADEKWIEDRIRKAGEFCELPDNLKEFKSAKTDDADASKADEDEGPKRIKGKLDQASIKELWSSAQRWSNDQAQKVMQEFYPDATSEDDEDEDEDEDDEDEEMEDVITDDNTDKLKEMLARADSSKPIGGAAASQPGAGNAADGQGAQNRAVPGNALGDMLRFMSTGERPS
ncbi:hypothetical protein BDV96DRAFT_604929 [Lophiotrema nucula]|uniref:Mediator of RNA polymerase II transcription subunit 8 n=1 Tax=Lophiotrema nucula TaxID=690887 RepID=A0A6A5YQB5_9PLEO|nr:hypothetical protein BDV96DRAFT_604929 [Lophiotrema nucula]